MKYGAPLRHFYHTNLYYVTETSDHICLVRSSDVFESPSRVDTILPQKGEPSAKAHLMAGSFLLYEISQYLGWVLDLVMGNIYTNYIPTVQTICWHYFAELWRYFVNESTWWFCYMTKQNWVEEILEPVNNNVEDTGFPRWTKPSDYIINIAVY